MKRWKVYRNQKIGVVVVTVILAILVYLILDHELSVCLLILACGAGCMHTVNEPEKQERLTERKFRQKKIRMMTKEMLLEKEKEAM